MVSCQSREDGKSDKYQDDRDNVINVDNRITDIKTDAIFRSPMLYVIDNYLVVQEIKPTTEKGIHFYDKNTFQYITSTGTLGHGPGEIVRSGWIGIDKQNRILWVPDHGRKVLLKFPMDSILANNMFKPSESLNLSNELFIERFDFLNDSIALGKAVHVIGNNSFDMTMAKLNITNNKTVPYGYNHPDATEKRSNSQFALSKQHKFYVNCYYYSDLMTICDLEGNLKYNIYGPDRLENPNNTKAYFIQVHTMGDKIIASYIGDNSVITNEFKRRQGDYPSKFLVFDSNGDYLKTIDTGNKFAYFCVDEANKRVITYFVGRENPLGYFDIGNI